MSAARIGDGSQKGEKTSGGVSFHSEASMGIIQVMDGLQADEIHP
jgi:hypothetical protein